MNSDVDLPAEIDHRITNYLRTVKVHELDTDEERHALLRALDGFGVVVGRWRLDLEPELVEIEFITETGANYFAYIQVALLGITVSEDWQLGYTPGDARPVD